METRRSVRIVAVNVYAVVDENGRLIQTIDTRGNAEMAIAKEFGISWSELGGRTAKKRSGKSFMAFLSADGRFREVVPAQRR